MQACPISFERYESVTSRIISFYTAVILSVFIYNHHLILLFFLFFDLSIRVMYEKKFSLLYQLGSKTRKVFKLEPLYKDAASKKLASYFGLLFLSLIILFTLLELKVYLLIVADIYLFCLLLDSFIDFCLGCKIYYIIKKIYPSFME